MDFPKGSLHDFLRGYFYLKSADWEGNDPKALAAWSASELQKLPYYYVMPLHSSMRESVSLHMKDENPEIVKEKSQRWLPDSDLAVYAQEWARTGFQGGLNWYRVATEEANMKDVELFAGTKVRVPLLFVSGRRDWGMYQEPGVVEKLEEVCERGRFKGVEVVEGAGHWVQQEQPQKVVEIVGKFLRDVKVEKVSM
jgi:pimeloyl-ACP methyl ester carboxylesterase